MRVKNLVLRVGTQNRFVNDWQEQEFHKYVPLKAPHMMQYMVIITQLRDSIIQQSNSILTIVHLRYGIGKREIPLAEEGLLQAILLAATPERLLETSLETVVRQVCLLFLSALVSPLLLFHMHTMTFCIRLLQQRTSLRHNGGTSSFREEWTPSSSSRYDGHLCELLTSVLLPFSFIAILSIL
jgi:hypothetical protein